MSILLSYRDSEERCLGSRTCMQTNTNHACMQIGFGHCRKKEVGTSAMDGRSVKVLAGGGRACINPEKLIYLYLASRRAGAHSLKGTIYIVRDNTIVDFWENPHR
jgi:hypothetical protein